MRMQSLIKIQVVDEKIITDGLHKHLIKSDESEYIQEKTDAANLIEVIPNATNLILSFKKIGKIENLVGFNNLTKLCLDNNCIQEIRNLSHLIHLKWLDLSFNEISKIEGLDQLINLEDLSLYNNKITLIEGLDTCINLKCLSIGNNQIHNIESILPLRQLKQLKMLTLAGNPMSTDIDYKKRMFAYFENLKFLDYLLVDTQERVQAKEQYANELIPIEKQDILLSEQNEINNAIIQRKAELDNAGILFIYTLFKDIFDSDAFVTRLKHLPGMNEQIIRFQEIVHHIATGFINLSLEKNSLRNFEIQAFKTAADELIKKCETDSNELMSEFEKSKSILFDMMNNKSTHAAAKTHIHYHEWEKLLKHCISQYETMCDELMSVELNLVEQFDIMIDVYDDKMNEFKTNALDNQNVFFRSIEETEKNFSSYIRSMCLDLIERASHDDFMNNLDNTTATTTTNTINVNGTDDNNNMITPVNITSESIDEEAFSLLMDRDVCLNVISACQELHISKILKQEDMIRQNEIKRYADIIADIKTQQHNHNRNRVLEIRNYSKTSKASLDVLLAVEDDDDMFVD